MLVKLGTLLVIAILVTITVYKPMYHISAPFEFAPIAPHSVSAPFDGYIARIAMVDETGKISPSGTRKIKPGDYVTEGDVLLELDVTDTRLKLAEALAQMKTKLRESEKYRAEDKAAESAMSFDEYEQSKAEADFLQNQIERATVKAPFTGQIIEGDLEDKLRAPVKQGDVLFDIASQGNLRVKLSVADRDIQDIRPDGHQTGRFATNALPDDKFDFVVDRVIPMGKPKEGNNIFEVYGNITAKPSESWRPGMAGEARVDVGNRRVIWMWTHRLIDFLKLKLWM